MSEAKFFQQVKSHHEHVLLYEDVALQTKALNCIPVDELKLKAKSAFQQSSSEKTSKMIPGVDDLLLIEFQTWFNQSFFKWMNSPSCRFCESPTHSVGHIEASSTERRWQANTVENYKCNSCGCETRFPRYNHPEKLLETRIGRCGEWANCFTLCCRALGFEARYVLDWTDHVWTEIFSKTQNKWLHCDPCENICDQPLIYEAGWKKKISYIIAFSKDEIRDVTWRYTTKPSQVLFRRNLCRENWLLNLTIKLTGNLQQMLPIPRKQELLKRFSMELASCTRVKDEEVSAMSGRTSGSLAWRTSRGETSIKAGSDKSVSISPGVDEKLSKLIHVRFNCARNTYQRMSLNEKEIYGWHKLAYFAENLHRKEERDWNMSYLARQEGTERAKISWKFDLKGK